MFVVAAIALYGDSDTGESSKAYIVGSFQNRGIPIWTPKYSHPYYWDPQDGSPNFGKPPVAKVAMREQQKGDSSDPSVSRTPPDPQGIHKVVPSVVPRCIQEQVICYLMLTHDLKIQVRSAFLLIFI